MKLHLPTRLRKALVATFVAVASLSPTVATGVVSGGIVTWALAAQQAQAADIDIAENTNWNEASNKNGDAYVVAASTLTIEKASAESSDITIDGISKLTLRQGATVELNEGSTLEVSKLDIHAAQTGDTDTVTINGGHLIVSGADTTSGTDYAAVTAGHWGSTSGKGIVSVTAGILDVLNGTFNLGWDSKGEFNISGGEANLKKLLFGQSKNYYPDATVTLSGTGCLNIGSGGISYGGSSTNKRLNLNGGTLGALDNWTLSGVINVQLGGDVCIDTDSYTVDIQTTIGGDGSGSLTKEGSGELILLSVNGSVVVSEGVLRLGSCEGLTSMTVKSGATVYLPSVSVSSTATAWVQDSTYYTAAAGEVDMSILTVEEGANVLASAGGSIYAAEADARVYADISCVGADGSLTIKKGNVMVCDPNNITAVAQSIASASKIILDGGTLFSVSNVWANKAVNYVVDADLEIKDAGGTLRAYGNDTTNTIDSTTYTGDITGNGTLHKTDGGRVILSGSLSGFTGNINLDAGILDIAGDTSSNVLISGGGILYISGNLTKGGDQTIQTNTRILSGGKLITARLDMLDWGGGKTITIEEGGELVVNHRQTAGGVHFVLNGGTIAGPGGNDTGEYRGLDIHESATSNVQVTADSLINTPIKVRNDASTLNAKVDAEKVLSISHRVFGGGKLNVTPYSTTEGATGGTVSITGSGVLECASVTLAANTTLDFNTTGDSTHSAAITGDATSQITKSGSAAITLSGVTNFAGSVNISAGALGFGQAATLGSLATNGGALLVDAGLATPAVLTLGTAPTGSITLLVKNVASITDAGVRVFADGTPMPTNANVKVESAIATDDTGSWVATYADGVLTKTSVTAATAGNLTWKTDGASNNWGATTAENWTKDSTAQRWADGSTVTFAGTGESISVVSAVTADSASVTGTGYEWVLGADKLTITNGVTVEENASLTITGLTTGDSANYEGVVTGAGTLVLKSLGVKHMDEISGAVSGDSGKTIATVEIAEGSALQWSSSGHVNALNNVTNFIVADGGRFDHRMNNSSLAGDGRTLTISGAGSSSLAGPAAALTFGYDCGAQANFHVARAVALAGDATVWVRSEATSQWTGGLDTAGHTLTLIGGGTLEYRVDTDALDNVILKGGTTLAYYHTREISSNGGDRMTVAELTVGENAADTNTLSVRHNGAIAEVQKLAGVGKLIVDSKVTHSTNMGAMLINGKAGAGFNGEIEVKQTDSGQSRRFVLATNSTDALADSLINLSTAAGSDTSSTTSENETAIGFAISGAANNSIKIQGIKSTEALGERVSLVSSNRPYEATTESSGIYGSLQRDLTGIADGVERTLEITGSGDYAFYGKVSAGLNLLMNGTGTQSFTGNMDAFNGTVEVQKGTLNLAALGSASDITLAGGTSLGVTAGVSGKTLSVAAVGAVLSADLTMAGGSLALGTAEAQWAKEGGLSLDSHKLVLDSANKGDLTINLGSEDYTGEVVQLFTNVSSLEDATGNAITITGATKVGDLFNTGTDASLADYLLNWDATNGTLSLIMKGEVADLVWNDGSDNNEWKNAGTHTNWKDDDTDTRFVLGDNVTFSGTTGETVTIVGTVNPLNVTVSAGDYTWDGTGSVEAEGKLTVGTDADTDAVSLTIENTGNKKFAGGVEVKESDTLVVTNATGWEGYVSGAGTLKLVNSGAINLTTFIDTSETADGPDILTIEGAASNAILQVTAANSLDAIKKVTDELQLGNATVDVDENATLSGSATVKITGPTTVDVAADKTLTIGTKLETTNLQTVKKEGDGTLALSGGATATANYSGLMIGGGTIKIADSGTQSDSSLGNYTFNYIELEDEDNGSGTLLLKNGNVTVNESISSNLTVNVATETAADVVNVSGIAGSALDSITLVQGSKLTGVTGDITVGGTGGTTSMDLTLDAANVGSSSTIAADKNAMIGQTGKLIINDGSVITLSVDAIASLLNQAANDSTSAYLHLTTGTLEATPDALSALVFKSGATSINLLEAFGVRLSGVEAGSLVLTGGANGIYTAADDALVSGYKELSAYQSTVVAPDKSLELTLDGAADDGSTAVINNLIGGTDSTLLISNTDDASTARVELKNTLQSITNPDPAEAVGADTEFAGDINGTGGVGDVEIVISGDGTLTVGGNVNTAQLTMSAGGLTLNGNDNTITTLADDGVAAGSTDADSTLTVNDLLTVEAESELTGTSIAGDGTLSLKDTLKLSDAATFDGVAVELQKDNFGTVGSLALDGVTGAEISALDGAGILQGGNDAELTVTGKGGSFSGSLAAMDGANSGATLKIADGASQTLDRVVGSTDWSVENAGELTINITNPAVTSGSGTNKPLTLDTLTLKDGSTTTMVLNTDAPANYLNLQELVVEDGATVALKSTGLNEIDFGGSITLAYAANGVTVGEDVTVELGNSAAFKKVKEAQLVSSADGKSLVLQTAYHDQNQYELMASSENSAAGAALLWSVNTGALSNGSALKAVDEAVNELSKLGTSNAAAQADKILAAVAGSSTAILGSALSSDVERQLRAIRNRTTTMGVGQCEVNEDMPYFNAWLNAEGDHHEMDADGLAAGYTRDSWGGTVGFDVDLTPNLTMGVALTAMYGDIESDSADKAEGDFDTQYISLFARVAANAWTHTFVATVGRADMTLDRTVNFGTGSYETSGDTEGTSFGFMYEVGRVFALTEDGDVCLQPVANVTFRHSTIDGYEESGCDATLAVDEQTYTALTFGVGARLQAVIGTSLYNRASILEARALAKFDVGDRESEVDVRLTQGGDTATVKSAEVGAFGAEFGVGVTVPVGSNAGSIFVDGSAEIRSGYTNVNGTIGYRINF